MYGIKTIEGILRKVWGRIVDCYFYCRLQKPVTALFGPAHKRHSKIIEIDVTYKCNLRCKNCNRSCGQAPTDDQMTLAQIKKFIEQSIENNMRWQEIRLVGGEPTLHENILEIIDLLNEYKKKYSPDMLITLITNGVSDLTKEVLKKLPPSINVENSHKDSKGYTDLAALPGQRMFDFNDAPCDHPHNIFVDYSSGCWIPEVHGMGLSLYGYYCCSSGSGIDRIFGYNLGRKTLPKPGDLMIEQRRVFCRVCGHYLSTRLKKGKSTCSPTWQKAYAKYKSIKPKLKLF